MADPVWAFVLSTCSQISACLLARLLVDSWELTILPISLDYQGVILPVAVTVRIPGQVHQVAFNG